VLRHTVLHELHRDVVAQPLVRGEQPQHGVRVLGRVNEERQHRHGVLGV